MIDGGSYFQILGLCYKHHLYKDDPIDAFTVGV